jgi:hypothetical protein
MSCVYSKDVASGPYHGGAGQTKRKPYSGSSPRTVGHIEVGDCLIAPCLGRAGQCKGEPLNSRKLYSQVGD